MMVDAQLHTALVDKTDILLAGLSLKQGVFCGKIALRGGGNINGQKENSDKDFLSKVKSVLGFDLPDQMLKSNEKKDVLALKTSFDEWLITCPIDALETIIHKLDQALQGQHFALIDQSDYYSMIELEGEYAKETLGFGITLDLDDSTFPIGMGSFTNWHLANICLIHKAKNHYQIMVRWSFSEYLYDYLAECITETKAIHALSPIA